MKLSTKVITTVLAVAVTFIGVASGAAPKRDKPLKVLAIGNSFSICVLEEMPKIAADLGCPKYLKIDSPQAVLMKKIANELRKR